MEAISFINSTTYGTNMSGWNASLNGTVPGQVMADLEDGLWFGNKRLPPRPDMHAEFVTALVKGKGGDLFTLKGNKTRLQSTIDASHQPALSHPCAGLQAATRRPAR